MTQEQIANLAPDQSRMRAHLLKAQDPSNAKTQQRPSNNQDLMNKANGEEMNQKIATTLADLESQLPHGPPVQVSPEARASMQQLAGMKTVTFIKRHEMTVRLFLLLTSGPMPEKAARDTLGLRVKFCRNLKPDGTLKDELNMGAEEFSASLKLLQGFMSKVYERLGPRGNQQGPGNNQQAQQLSQGQQSQAVSGAQTQAAQAQLTPQNLRINDQQQRQQQSVPAAPVAARPPFQIGAQSPRGAPTYFEGAREVKDLKLPDKKRQRLDNQAPTPVTKPSPRLGAGQDGSPDRRAQVPAKVDQRPMFRCAEAGCDHSWGFETQALLTAHIQEAHAKIEDPVQFAISAMGDRLGVDSQTGLPKKANVDARPAAASSRPAPQATKPGQTPATSQNVPTPAGQQAAATPMARLPTLKGGKDSPSTNLLKTPQTVTKAATPSSGALAKATPLSGPKPLPKEADQPLVSQAPAEHEKEAFAPLDLGDIFQDYGSMDITVLDLKDQDDSWVFRSDTPAKTTPDSSPKHTPDSTFKNTPTTRQSDISENDNLQMNIELEGAETQDSDMADSEWRPPAWHRLEAGDFSQWPPLDAQVCDDISRLGVLLPDMTEDEKLLFNPDMAANDMLTMDSILGPYGL
jgi:hypothetical protein